MNKVTKRGNLFRKEYKLKFSVYEIFMGNTENVHPFLILLKNNKLVEINPYKLPGFNQSLLYIRLGTENIFIPFFENGRLLTEEEINKIKTFKSSPFHSSWFINLKDIVLVWNLLQEFSPQEVFNILIDSIRIGTRNYATTSWNGFRNQGFDFS